MAEYCASKAAVSQLHACLRWELRGARGVRCLLVRPYLIATPLFAGGAPTHAPEPQPEAQPEPLPEPEPQH